MNGICIILISVLF